MANVIYKWNPWQDQIDSHIPAPGQPAEILKLSTDNNRREFVPRAAPFFANGFVLRRQGDPEPLKFGVDYVFAHSFDRFIDKYNRNVFGSVVVLKDFGGDVLVIDGYDTIGGPFTLNDVAFAELVANIVNAPRHIDWEMLDQTTVPTEWPADPHPHPVANVYDFADMMVQLRSFILSLFQAQQGFDMQKMFEEHVAAHLFQAHPGSKADLGLSQAQNIGPATVGDLSGNSPNLYVTMEVYKEGLKLLANGQLPLN